MGSLRTLSLSAWISLGGFSCTAIEFGSGGIGGEGPGTGAAGGATTSGGASQGGSGAGGAAGAGGEAGAGLGGGPGSGGEGGCLGPDACDGTDGDCDGWADDPLGDTGLACGCYWGTYDARRYVACSFNTYASATCPLGMQLAVPQSTAERNFIGGLAAPTSTRMLVGLTQSSTATSPSAGWSWLRPGVPVDWAFEEPNDWASTKPPYLETGAEQCGDILGSAGLNDNSCVGGVFVACEEITSECLEGEPCELALGCEGSFDCTQTDQCVASPIAEVCNGRDDDCNGAVDDGSACGCVLLGATHKFCGTVASIEQVQCGDGWSLATLGDQAELNALVVQLNPNDRHLVGLVQREAAGTVGALWHDSTGTMPNGLAAYWAPGEPNDADGAENHEEDCSAIAYGGLIDQPCTGVLSYYVCELD